MLSILLALLACDPKAAPDDSAGETGDPAHTGEAAEDTAPALTAPEYSGGTCPTLVEGTNEGFASGGQERSFELRLPADPVGAPVVFGWHWLGGSASQALRALELSSLTEEGVIVVAPESCCSAYEWNFFAEAEENVDLALFDDLLACLDDQYQVDLTRIYATGMSAGGLWTTYLTMYRSEHLAATAPFSGGTEPFFEYSTPTDDIPVLVTWGGEDDLYAGLSFETASEGFAAALLQDGHFVATCDHGGGHVIPSGPQDYYWPFFEAHPKFVSPEPWAAALPAGYPAWCGVATATE